MAITNRVPPPNMSGILTEAFYKYLRQAEGTGDTYKDENGVVMLKGYVLNGVSHSGIGKKQSAAYAQWAKENPKPEGMNILAHKEQFVQTGLPPVSLADAVAEMKVEAQRALGYAKKSFLNAPGSSSAAWDALPVEYKQVLVDIAYQTGPLGKEWPLLIKAMLGNNIEQIRAQSRTVFEKVDDKGNVVKGKDGKVVKVPDTRRHKLRNTTFLSRPSGQPETEVRPLPETEPEPGRDTRTVIGHPERTRILPGRAGPKVQRFLDPRYGKKRHEYPPTHGRILKPSPRPASPVTQRPSVDQWNRSMGTGRVGDQTPWQAFLGRIDPRGKPTEFIQRGIGDATKSAIREITGGAFGNEPSQPTVQYPLPSLSETARDVTGAIRELPGNIAKDWSGIVSAADKARLQIGKRAVRAIDPFITPPIADTLNEISEGWPDVDFVEAVKGAPGYWAGKLGLEPKHKGLPPQLAPQKKRDTHKEAPVLDPQLIQNGPTVKPSRWDRFKGKLKEKAPDLLKLGAMGYAMSRPSWHRNIAAGMGGIERARKLKATEALAEEVRAMKRKEHTWRGETAARGRQIDPTFTAAQQQRQFERHYDLSGIPPEGHSRILGLVNEAAEALGRSRKPGADALTVNNVMAYMEKVAENDTQLQALLGLIKRKKPSTGLASLEGLAGALMSGEITLDDLKG